MRMVAEAEVRVAAEADVVAAETDVRVAAEAAVEAAAGAMAAVEGEGVAVRIATPTTVRTSTFRNMTFSF